MTLFLGVITSKSNVILVILFCRLSDLVRDTGALINTTQKHFTPQGLRNG